MKKASVAKQDDSARFVLLATADIAYGKTLEDFMAVDRYQIERVHDAAGVLRLVGRRNFDVLVLDLDLSRESPVELVSFVRQQDPGVRIILLFDPARVESALEGLRNGAYLYLPHSCPPSDVAMVVNRALRSKATEAAMGKYEQTVFEELVGSTPAMQRVVDLIRKVAPTDSTVLLLGESGTGKEVLANTLHRLSRRRAKPFIAINCAALPEALLESEMFGHVKGAFTGAERDKRGLFEEADGGTIFLDEIGDMSPITQAKVLRVLQNGEMRRVGAGTTMRVDVRVIAATNRDLVEAVKSNAFREDLYYRLNVIQIRIPPLRERRDAVPALVSHFLAQHNARFDKHLHGVDDHAMSLLVHYEFPGNVRELESILAHAVIMAEGEQVRAQDLPDPVRFGVSPRLALPYQAPAVETEVRTLAEMEEQHLRRALLQLDGNQTAVAKKLGISRSTLWRKMKEFGIEP